MVWHSCALVLLAALLLEDRIDDGAQRLGQVGKLAHVIADHRPWHVPQCRTGTSWADVAVGRLRIWVIRSICWGILELDLDGLPALPVCGPGLAVVPIRFVAHHGHATSLTGHAADQFLPAEPIILGPHHVGECQGTGRIGSGGGRWAIASTRSRAVRTSDSRHPDIVWFRRRRGCLPTELGLVALWVLETESLETMAVPIFVAGSFSARHPRAMISAVRKDLRHHSGRALLERDLTVRRQIPIYLDGECAEVGPIALLTRPSVDIVIENPSPELGESLCLSSSAGPQVRLVKWARAILLAPVDGRPCVSRR